MFISEIWRYPVKSMGGERVASAEIGRGGVVGDRRVAVFDRRGPRPDHPVSARAVPGILLFHANLGPDGPMIAGPELPRCRWDHPMVATALSAACGRELELGEVPGGAFDDSPLHVVDLEDVRILSREMGKEVSPRRFRANLYLDTAAPQAVGHARPGTRLVSGQLELAFTAACPRCAITTRDPDTNEVWSQLLRQLVAAHQEQLGAYCQVEVPGRAREGDPVQHG